MPVDSPYATFALALASGVTTHLLLYRHGEWDLQAPKIVISYAALLFAALTVEHMNVLEIAVPRQWAVGMLGCHILGVYGSILIYRAFFHRLSQFPGPFPARSSNFYVTALSAKNLHLYEETQKLHKQYGDYVRLGPTELSIADPAAVKAIYSSVAKGSKGPWYNVQEPLKSLHMVRDKPEHARRRKAWDQGYSTRALRDYEPRVSLYTDQLVQAIEKELGTPMNVTRWFNYYSFDVMGDLSFGKSFNMLVDGKDSYVLTQLHGDMKNIGLFSHLTWLFPFFKRTPGLNAEYLKFWNWVEGRVKERIQNPPDLPDVFSWILKAFNQGQKTKQDNCNLPGDAFLIIVAGSDTTAATLTNLFYHLASDRALCEQLRTELDALPELSHDKLMNVKLLNGAINEALRLHPPVPSGTQRLTPPQGITIGARYIPGNVMVCMSSHSIFRDERAFVRPTEFLPERWTTQPELVKEPSAFIPFNGVANCLGPYSCAGKQLALMELCRVTAEILTRYDVSLAKGQTEAAFLDGKRDTFTLVSGQLEVVFTRRDGAVQDS